nr:glycoside hydrolase [Cesiribacter sp. SM1]
MLIVLCFLCWGCGLSSEEAGRMPDDMATKTVTIRLNPAETYQTIDNFGASDAWACQFVGNWPDDKRNAIADLLFSTDTTAEGKPKGIGLSLWRFNIGAGSAQQGSNSGIGDEWRRAESFLQQDGTYDWQRQQGQQWFMQAARQRGVQKFLAFPNSPPVWLNKNGKAFATAGKSNLAPDRYQAYAAYLLTVLKGLKDKGIDIQYLSPVNEPQWDWSDGGQEGTPFTNEEIFGIVKELNEQLEQESIDTKIDVAEAGKINYLYATEDRPGRGNQVYDFFNPASPLYIGGFSRVGNVISAHSYFTTSPFPEAVEKRNQLAAAVAAVPNLEYWMSEYCILGDNEGEIKGEGRNLGIDPAIYLARVIHNDLVVANATAWHWWLGVSPYNYKDGLVYVDKEKTNGNYYESKLLWALGNYSRFIRPGAVRIAAQSSDLSVDDSSLLFSAYTHPQDNQIISVIINSGIAAVGVKLEFAGIQVENLRFYQTSESDALTAGRGRAEDMFTIPPRSIITVVGNIK